MLYTITFVNSAWEQGQVSSNSVAELMRELEVSASKSNLETYNRAEGDGRLPYGDLFDAEGNSVGHWYIEETAPILEGELVA